MKFLFKALAFCLCVCFVLSGCDTKIGQTTTTTITEEIEETEENEHQTNTSSKEKPTSSKKPVSSKKPQPSSKPVSSQVSSTVITLPASSSPENVTSTESEFDYTVEQRDAYAALNDTQKKVYAVIRNMVENMTEGLVVIPTDSEADATLAYKAVNLDYPEYFWMPLNYIFAMHNNKYMIAMKYNDAKYSFDYLYSKARVEAMQKTIDTKTAEILALLKEDDSDYTKELKLHDFLCDTITYPTTSSESYHFNIYGALVKGSAVCEGYSRAMQYLCRKVGIECILVTGYSKNEGHMWNQIKIGGEWYNLDLTWNDGDASEDTWHTYFNFNDTSAAVGHTFDPLFKTMSDEDICDDEIQYNIVRHPCSATKYNHAVVNDILLTNDKEQNRFVANSATLQAFNKGTGYIDFYISEEVELKGTVIDELFAFFELDKAFATANSMLLDSGIGPFYETIGSRNGRGYRIYYE